LSLKTLIPLCISPKTGCSNIFHSLKNKKESFETYWKPISACTVYYIICMKIHIWAEAILETLSIRKLSLKKICNYGTENAFIQTCKK
jgi:hypothetical protein